MNKMAENQPRLAAPGAGIPAVERIVGGSILKLRCAVCSRGWFTAQFEQERKRIEGLYIGRDVAVLAKRVLIPRLRGLEDSSRYWSVLMTLDHLRIVNISITGVIHLLTNGRMPEGKASTAHVKPSESVNTEVVSAYEASCDSLVSLIASINELRTSLRYAHPWFGPLDARGWHAMSAMHMGIHRAQIELINRGQ